jgi:UDP:flavonoid glycosyltransferase YjiC (YdhE family)
MKHQSKPLLLVFPFGLLSHYLRCIEFGRHLSPYFKIKFASHSNYNHFVEMNGFSTFDCETINPYEAIDGLKNFNFSWLNENNIRNTFLNYVKVIEHYEPAAVLGDAVPALKMAAEYTNVFHISLLNTYMSKIYAGERPLPKAHPLHHYMKKLPGVICEMLAAQGQKIAFRKIHKPFRKMRKEYRLSSVKNYFNEQEGELTILCDLPSLFPTSELPESYCITGPMIYDGENDETYINPKQIDPLKKIIYVTMGSTGDWNKVAFLNDPVFGKYNIVTSGDHLSVIHGPNVIRFPFITGKGILPKTDLVICHGGNGSIYQALAYGLPVLCLPAHFEQEWNVLSIERVSLGQALEYGMEPAYYEKTIQKWICKKHNPEFSNIKKQVYQSATNLKMVTENIHSKTIERIISNDLTQAFLL